MTNHVERTVFRRNRQVGWVLLLVSVFVAVILFLDVYDVDLGFYITLQWAVLILLALTILLEFTVPFAVIRKGKLIVREIVLIRTVIRIHDIADINMQNRRIEIILKNGTVIRLLTRYLHHNDKKRFISALENLITYST